MASLDEPRYIVCSSCGNENPLEAEYCFKCGKRIWQKLRSFGRPQDLASILTVGSLYLLLESAVNRLVQVSGLILTLHVTAAILGFSASYLLTRQSARRWAKLVSAAALGIALSSTVMLYLIGLNVRGVIGPAWIIFLYGAWLLWRSRTSRVKSPAAQKKKEK